MARKFTVVAQLHEKDNKDLIAYAEDSFEIYGKALRETFYHMRNSKSFERSGYNTYLQNKYNITKRSANSVIIDARGRLNALAELKEYELKQLKRKIEYFETELIPDLENKRDRNSEQLRHNPQDKKTVERQQNLRKKIVSKKNKLNKMKQKAGSLDYQINTGRYRLCFGTKYLLQRDMILFRQKRDSHLKYVGTAAETNCNQMFQMAYSKHDNQFYIQLRKDYGGYKNNKRDKYVYGKCHFNAHKNELKHILKNHASPLTYEIIRRNNRYYLHCTFEMPEPDIRTHKESGAIGIDFNKGFLAVSEVNHYGHLVDQDVLRYRFQQGNATETDLEKIANDLCRQALITGKDIAIESLDFKTAKSRAETKQGRKYNGMIHSLAYKKYVRIMETAAFKHGVRLRKVNPAWTSWLGRKLYCDKMKLNVHTAAGYVIARRGMEIQEPVA